MEKPADSDLPILEVIKRRWSPRAFNPRLIEPHKVRCILEAARWSASSYNEQPWSFILATRDQSEAFEKMLGCLVEANRAWAAAAPLLILTTSRQRFSRNDKPNRVYVHDLGLAVQNLTIQATAMNLFVHQMAGVDTDKVREAYSVPEGHDPVTAIAVGYGGNPDDLPENLREMEHETRDRKPLSEFVFEGAFGNPAAVVSTDK